MSILFAVGDGATGNSDSAKLADTIAMQNPELFLWLGDVYESGTAAEFEANYKPSWGKLDDRAYPIPGNHDWPNYQDGYKPYFERALRPSDPFYARSGFDGWSIIMLNSEQPMGLGSDQYTFAEAFVRSMGGRKNIACWHRPRYCSGSHGDATDSDALWQLLAPHCTLIFGGHAHNAQVFKPDQTGCVQVVSGAGGRSLYAEIPGDERLQWGESSGYCAARAALGADQVDLSFIDEAGQTIWQTVIGAG